MSLIVGKVGILGIVGEHGEHGEHRSNFANFANFAKDVKNHQKHPAHKHPQARSLSLHLNQKPGFWHRKTALIWHRQFPALWQAVTIQTLRSGCYRLHRAVEG